MRPYTYIHRKGSSKLRKLFQTFPCVGITGARQVGKSTLIEHLFPDIPCFVFDPVHDIHNVRQDPELFLNNNPPPLILDEVQYVPELFPVLKRRIDANKKRPGQYILTGSQQWGVMREIAESMAGRCILMHLDSFSIGELVDPQPKGNWLEAWLEDPESFFIKKPDRLRLPYSLYETLWRGFMPEVQRLDLEFVSDFHSSYQSTYIEKDIRQIEEIQNVQQFSRFVRLLGALTAQEVNYSEIGREIGITPQTAKRWLNLLSLTFEWREIPAYSNNLTKKVSLKPKGYFTDTGQVCFVQMISSPNALSGHPLYGALFETACVNEIAKLAKLIPTPPQLYHWRLHSGSECDLILERDGKLYPIEIKSKTRPNRKDARGIEAFRGAHTDQKVQKGLILAPAEEAYFVTENTLVIPWDSGWGRT